MTSTAETTTHGRAQAATKYGLLLSNLTLDAIQAEATRAHLKHGPNSILYGGDDRRHRILVEEVGEVARELNDAEIEDRPVDRDRLVKELIQVAAMCATWVEALEGAPAAAHAAFAAAEASAETGTPPVSLSGTATPAVLTADGQPGVPGA